MKASTVAFALKNPIRAVRLAARKLHELRHPDEPWLADGAIAYCDQHLTRDHAGLEWGSGKSTAWFGRRLGRLTSIEHDPAWQAIVHARLVAEGLAHVDHRHIPLDHAEDEPSREEYEVTPAYVAVANDFPDESLDLAIVDGHYRQACIRAVLRKLKRGGLLLVDNTDWMPLEHWGVPRDWPVVHQSRSARSETTLWRKP